MSSDAQEKRVHLEFELSAVEHHVAADTARLHQVFWNLVKNAIKFTPAGGKITVRTTNPTPGRVALTIRDNGIGIDRETLSVVFHPFEQGSTRGLESSSGLGLGLSISKAIVELHGGTITAESPGPGLGALFSIGLETVAPFPARHSVTNGAATIPRKIASLARRGRSRADADRAGESSPSPGASGDNRYDSEGCASTGRESPD